MLQQEFDDTPEGQSPLGPRSFRVEGLLDRIMNHALEIEAARIRSDQIDADLAQEGVVRAKQRKEESHVLLLGKLL